MTATRKYVIQKHTSPGDIHWDLMFETGDVLETFRVNLPPEELRAAPATVTKIFDHPLKFLTYEGSVNQQKARVRIVDTGTYELLTESENTRKLHLTGQILNGNYTMNHKENDKWLFSPD